MNTRQTAKLIEAIVRKVVREELKPFLKEVKQSKPKPKKVKRVEEVEKFDPFDVSHIIENKQKSKPKPKKTFSKNKVLNGLLTETYESDEWRNINANQPTFMSHQAQGFGARVTSNMGGQTPTANNMAPTVDPDGRPMDVDLEGTGIGKALTRDYSSLMKKINAKKGA